MEPITLCGVVILAFGLWVEFESTVRALIKAILTSRLFKEIFSATTDQKPVYGGRMPVCHAKAHHY
ncbi:MAG TPA: hypothetical protein HPP76_11870 [Desulfuromonadales bacterium]|nr:hypothetical protein [Desulfuromonadales bacterium]